MRLKKRGGPVLHGDCLDLIPTLDDGSVSLVVTSPPYAQQRAGHYEGIPEEDYPDFTVNWMTALAPKMTPMGRFSWSFVRIFVMASFRTTCYGPVWQCVRRAGTSVRS